MSDLSDKLLFQKGDMVVRIDVHGNKFAPNAFKIVDGPKGEDGKYYDIRSLDGDLKLWIPRSRLRFALPEEVVNSGWPGEVRVESDHVCITDPRGEIVYWDQHEWMEDPGVVAVIVRAVRLNFQHGSIGVREMIVSTSLGGPKVKS